MDKTGIIIAGGDLSPAFAEKIIRETGSRGSLCIAAADAGLEILDRIGLMPDILLGDFDTVRQEVLQDYTERNGVEVIRHNPVKDASDMELTADVLLQRGIRHILVLGALGGRADHTVANIRLTYWMRSQGAELVLLDPQNRIRCLIPGEGENVFSLERTAQWGRYVGLFALGGTIRHLTLEGFKYPLKDYTLDGRGLPSLTISNEITADTGVIRFSGDPGAGLLIMETADRSARTE